MRFTQLHEHVISESGSIQLGESSQLEMLRLISQSQKFFAGCIEKLPIVSIADFPKLPFAIIGIEFRWEEDGRGSSFAFVEDTGGDTWLLNCFIDVSPYGYVHIGQVEGVRGSKGFFVTPRGPQRENMDQKTADVFYKALDQHVNIVCRFLEVLNASNVTTQEIAASKQLAKARMRRRKLPLYTYKVLVLKTSTARFLGGAGHHDSPRIHLRRGHLKKRKSGIFWWQPHAVGDRKRGIVVKDYDASRISRSDG